MWQRINKILSCIIMIGITCVLLLKMTELMEAKDSVRKYDDFFKQEENFDVLFMGTSHILNAVYPMEMWNDYGIVSYNFGGHSNQLPTSYWMIKNALDYTHPKVIVLDCFGIASDTKTSSEFAYLHFSFDAFPLSVNKIRAVYDLLDDPVYNNLIWDEGNSANNKKRTKIELLWNYSIYHSRWSEINRNDFELLPLYEKGAETRIAVSNGKMSKISREQKLSSGSVGDFYLKKIIELCRDKDIELVLTYLPFPAKESQQEEANYIYDISEKYGVKYINFLDLDIVDFETDLFDDYSHLNPSGARKITNYLGDYLIKNCGIVDNHDNVNYLFWNDDYVEYTVNVKDKNLISNNDLEEYLMLLSNDTLEILLDIGNKKLIKNEKVRALLFNLGVDVNKINDDTNYILIDNYYNQISLMNDVQDDEQLKILGIMRKDLMTRDSLSDSSLVVYVSRNHKLIDVKQFD